LANLDALQYDRVDPAEVQAMKDEVETLKKFKADFEPAKATLEQELTAKQAELESQTSTLATEKARLQAFQSHMRNQLSSMNEKHNVLAKQNTELQAKLAAAESAPAPKANPAPSAQVTEELKKKDAALVSVPLPLLCNSPKTWHPGRLESGA
jgi:DNA anti-recombination protein RmuC